MVTRGTGENVEFDSPRHYTRTSGDRRRAAVAFSQAVLKTRETLLVAIEERAISPKHILCYTRLLSKYLSATIFFLFS